jgi:hypothetical protein
MLERISTLKTYSKIKRMEEKGKVGEEDLYYVTASDAAALARDAREILHELENY